MPSAPPHAPAAATAPGSGVLTAVRSIFLLDMPNRSAALDGIRALAALWVFNTHVGWMHFVPDWILTRPVLYIPFNALRTGDLGVDIFFALSGYLIFKSVRRYRTDQVGRFVQKRYARLGPAYLFSIVLALVTAARGLEVGAAVASAFAAAYFLLERRDGAKRVFMSCFRYWWIFTLVAGVTLFALQLLARPTMVTLFRATDPAQQALFKALRTASNLAFTQDATGPLLGVFNAPTWSLSLEFYFYLGIAGLWWVKQRFGWRFRAWHVVAGILGYYAFFWLATPYLAPLQLRAPDSQRCLAFVIGVLMVYLTESAAWTKWRPVLSKLGVPALAALGVLAYVRGQWIAAHPFPQWPVENAITWLAVDVSIFVLLGSALSPGSLTARVFGSMPVRILGALSYSIFLVHYPVQIALKQGALEGRQLMHWLASLGVTLVLAVVCYYFLERPYFTSGERRKAAIVASSAAPAVAR